MTTLRLGISLLLLCLSACSASHRWTLLDIARQTVLLTELEVDRRQTIHAQQQGFTEIGMFGTTDGHPTHGEINRYFASYAVIHTAVAAALPSRWTKNDFWWFPSPRALWQMIAIGDEYAAIRINWKLGIKP